MRCAYAGDAGTRALSPLDGCGRRFCNASTPAGRVFCPQLPYLRLAEMLRAHAARGGLAKGYNELILDAAALEGALPRAVEAFFYVEEGGYAYAQLVRRAFRAAYPRAGDVPPVVRLDPRAPDAPFAVPPPSR